VVVDRGDCDAKRTEDFEPKSQQRDCRESGVVCYRAPSWEVEIRRASRLASARDSSALSYHLAQMVLITALIHATVPASLIIYPATAFAVKD
jgi:hypothetical protein